MPAVTRIHKGKGFARKPSQTKADALAIQPVPIAESVSNHFVRMLIYGRPGTGKTRFFGTCPTPSLHIVSSSAGVNEGISIKNVEGIDQWEITEPEQLPAIVEILKTGKYQSACLDHVSGFSDLILAKIMGVERLPEQSSWGMATREQYGQCTLQLKEYLRGLINSPCHIIITAHERDFASSTESTGEDVVVPFVGASLSPSGVRWLNGACDYICQAFTRDEVIEKKTLINKKEMKSKVKTGKQEFCFRTGPDPVYMTRFRLPIGMDLPKTIVDPTFAKVMETIGE